jgi:serine/threonine protein kinase
MQDEKNYIFNRVKYRAVKKFFSRINSVYLIESINDAGQKYILKDFEDNNDRIKSELAGMEIYKDHSPKVIYSDSRYLIHEYIQGETFLSYFEESERNNSSAANPAALMLNFLKAMYKSAPEFILGDINFNNFIINCANSDSKIKFIDFENVKTGENEEDLGRINAFALTYDPAFTGWKYSFVSELIAGSEQVLKADKAKIYLYSEKEFEAMNKRRRAQIEIPEVLTRIKSADAHH